MSQKFRQKYFGSGAFYKEVVVMAIPVMGQILIQSLVSLVDNFMVAELGDIKMSGVNVAGQILYLFQVLINAVCTAGGIFMSQFYGAAIATFSAMIIQMIAFIVYLLWKKPPFMLLSREDLYIDRALFFKMLRRCFMTILSEMILVISGTYMTALFNGRGGAGPG